MKAFIESQFAYCPLISMFKYSKELLEFAHNNNESTFKVLLTKDDSVSIHHKNIWCPEKCSWEEVSRKKAIEKIVPRKYVPQEN